LQNLLISYIEEPITYGRSHIRRACLKRVRDLGGFWLFKHPPELPEVCSWVRRCVNSRSSTSTATQVCLRGRMQVLTAVQP